jgi:hypothetical protein
MTRYARIVSKKIFFLIQVSLPCWAKLVRLNVAVSLFVSTILALWYLKLANVHDTHAEMTPSQTVKSDLW